MIILIWKLCLTWHFTFFSQYLHKLFKRDHHKGQRYHERQIGLYAEYDRPNLLPFLRDSIHCPLEKVLRDTFTVRAQIQMSVKYISLSWHSYDLIKYVRYIRTMMNHLTCTILQALEICQERNFVEEMVFLLSKCPRTVYVRNAHE